MKLLTKSTNETGGPNPNPHQVLILPIHNREAKAGITLADLHHHASRSTMALHVVINRLRMLIHPTPLGLDLQCHLDIHLMDHRFRPQGSRHCDKVVQQAFHINLLCH